MTLREGRRYTARRSSGKDSRLPFEPLDQYLQRKKKLAEIEALGEDPIRTGLTRRTTPAEIVAAIWGTRRGGAGGRAVDVRTAGRILTLRLHGKAGFAHIQGAGGRLQIYVKLDVVGERAFRLFQLLDMGDIDRRCRAPVPHQDERADRVRWSRLTLLTKALLPLPEKWHGLADVELRYRQRYLDLIANPRVREIFCEARGDCCASCAGFSIRAATWKWKRR